MNMKRIILIVLTATTFLNLVRGNDNIEKWTINLEGAIFGTPLIHENTIIAGTESGKLFWINAETGKIIRTSTVEGSIRSSALVLNNKLFIEANGSLFCFNAETAKLLYRIRSTGKQLDMLDPWDYFHTSPVEHNGCVYFAGNDNKIYAVDTTSGNVVRKIKTPEGAPIRSSLTFHNGNLYFGDNNGVVYEYNLATNKYTMKYKTYIKKPYSTYGMITGGPFIYNDKIIFSNRHETFTLLNLNTKSIAWSRTDKNGSWWPLIPVVAGNKIIIGGSDNYILSALNIDTGEILWDFGTDLNMFCKPLVVGKSIIVGTGDAYSNIKGHASVYSVNLETGLLINKYNPNGNVFASPVKCGKNIIICTTSGYIHSIPEKFFTNPSIDSVYVEGDFEVEFKNESSSINTLNCLLNNTGEKVAKLNYRVETHNLIPDTLLRIDLLKDSIYSSGVTKLCLQINRGNLKPGQYQGEIAFEVNKEYSIVKPFSITVEGAPNKNQPEFEVKNFTANATDLSASYNLTVNRNTKIIGLLTLPNSDSIVGYIPKTQLKWGNYSFEKEIIALNGKKIRPGKYCLKLKSKGLEIKYEYHIH